MTIKKQAIIITVFLLTLIFGCQYYLSQDKKIEQTNSTNEMGGGAVEEKEIKITSEKKAKALEYLKNSPELDKFLKGEICYGEECVNEAKKAREELNEKSRFLFDDGFIITNNNLLNLRGNDLLNYLDEWQKSKLVLYKDL